VFFNNTGYLGMCGHGLIGVVRSLAFTGQLRDNTVTVDTPVGAVHARLLDDGSVAFENVASHCSQTDVMVDVPGYGAVSGDVAFGGNWFFITDAPLTELSPGNTPQLLHITQAISSALLAAGISGDEGAVIDHIELSGPAHRRDADSRNFVLCPGGEFDRSPCGTGTSAKLTTLHARGLLKPGQEYRQESITGSLFVGTLRESANELIPTIRGSAFITGRSDLNFSADDPFRGGIAFA
jgi:proline racemase